MKPISLYSTQHKLLYRGVHANVREALEQCVRDKINLDRVHLSGANLKNVELDGWRVTGAKLTRCNLRGANFSEAFLRHCDFSYCDLSEVCFCYSDLTHCDFRHAKWRETDFSQAKIDHSSFDCMAPKIVDLSRCYSAEHLKIHDGMDIAELPAFLLTNHHPEVEQNHGGANPRV